MNASLFVRLRGRVQCTLPVSSKKTQCLHWWRARKRTWPWLQKLSDAVPDATRIDAPLSARAGVTQKSGGFRPCLHADTSSSPDS